MLNKLHVLSFKQVSYPSQRNNSGSAVVYSMYDLHKKSPHHPVFHKTPVTIMFKNCRCGCAQKDLIQSAKGRPDQRKEHFHDHVVSSSFFIPSVWKRLLKNRIQSSAYCSHCFGAMPNTGIKGLHLIDMEG